MTTKRKIGGAVILLLLIIIVTATAYHRSSSDGKMVGLLRELRNRNFTFANPFSPEVKLIHVDSLLSKPGNENNPNLLALKASLSVKVGKETQAVQTYESLINKMDFMNMGPIMPDIGIAYMRLGKELIACLIIMALRAFSP